MFDQVEHAVDCVARSLIRGFLISTAKPMDGIQRGILRGSDKFELNGPLDGCSSGQARGNAENFNPAKRPVRGAAAGCERRELQAGRDRRPRS